MSPSPKLPRQRNRYKKLVVVGSLLCVLGITIIWKMHTIKAPAQQTLTQKTKIVNNADAGGSKDPQPQRIRVLAAGDFIAHDAVNQAAKKADGSYDYMPLMSRFTAVFQAADIRFCNDANLTAGAAYGISGYPKFNAPTEFARDMGKIGCNMVNVGTNHSFDRNQDAINASIDTWKAVPQTLAVVGHNRTMADHDVVQTFSVKGVKFAFLAYTTYLNVDAPVQNDYGVNVYSDAFAKKQIAAAKAEGAEVIIVSIRWGTEYSPGVTAAQRQTAQFLADQGVSLVLGHGPHVLAPVATLTGSGGNKTVVWYSLGNFLNTQISPETVVNGLGVIDYDKTTKQITSMGFLPIYMHYEWTAAQAANEDLMARHNLGMYMLDDASQTLFDAQQLKTTPQAQRTRLQNTLNSETKVPLISLDEYKKYRM